MIIEHMNRLIIVFTVLSISLFSCEKDSDNSSPESFFKVSSFQEDYTTEGCIELSDRSVIVCGASVGNSLNDPNYGEGFPKMVKYGPDGELLWARNIPKTLYLLEKAIPLRDGGFVLGGYDNTQASAKFTIAIYDNAGNLLRTNSFYNQSGIFIFGINAIEIVQLANGNYAVAVTRTRGINDRAFPIVYILDPDLNLLMEKNLWVLFRSRLVTIKILD